MFWNNCHVKDNADKTSATHHLLQPLPPPPSSSLASSPSTTPTSTNAGSGGWKLFLQYHQRQRGVALTKLLRLMMRDQGSFETTAIGCNQNREREGEEKQASSPVDPY
ncbi:hypothetical protein RRG08_059422 [Elysia crispata]|uniref:Uncharacterized protein n=1 Tax=Elysia crispata TaxID=231223 RepID=A0AAE1A5R6_9GAST|nr:hypothetical protein RRG08_059422 [Elysia crispata]